MPQRGAKTTAIAKVTAIKDAENAPDGDGEEILEQYEATDENDLDMVGDIEEIPRFEYIEHVPKDPSTIFQTFNTKTDLEPGLCAVRRLGRNKYEIVNLQSVTAFDLTTPAMTETLQNDENRLAMFAMDELQWKSAEFVCNQAVAGSSRLQHELWKRFEY